MVLEYLWQQGEIETITDYVLWIKLAVAADTDINSTRSLCDAYMAVQTVKMIMASTEEEFEALKAEAIRELENKGYGDVVASIEARYAAAREAAGGFTLK